MLSDYNTASLAEVRRDYLASSTSSMPIAGMTSWASLSITYIMIGNLVPSFAPFVAAAIPFPLAIIIDKLRRQPGIRAESRRNPITRLFMNSITMVALLIPLVIISASAAESRDILVLGLALLAGTVWVPHGWGADDPAGVIHFVARSILCYLAYLLAPEPSRAATIAGVTALTYGYAIIAMKQPATAR